jgi:hypothetical protein
MIRRRGVVVLALAVASFFAAPPTVAGSYANVQVEPDGWGEAAPEDVQAVAVSAVGAIHSTMKATAAVDINLRNGSGPITAFRTSSSAPFDVTVAIGGRKWAQLAYQFSHEYCHVRTLNLRVAQTSTDWFEESLCEAVSLLSIERMSVSWRTAPPYPNWKSYAPSLAEYANEVEQRPTRQLPKNTSFAQWFACTAATGSGSV